MRLRTQSHCMPCWDGCCTAVRGDVSKRTRRAWHARHDGCCTCRCAHQSCPDEVAGTCVPSRPVAAALLMSSQPMKMVRKGKMATIKRLAKRMTALGAVRSVHEHLCIVAAHRIPAHLVGEDYLSIVMGGHTSEGKHDAALVNGPSTNCIHAYSGTDGSTCAPAANAPRVEWWSMCG